MLRELIVENLGVIERAELELGRGSSALTGETGAGKTLVVSALGLLLGARADSSLIRSGARQARVEAGFLLESEHPVLAVLRSRDLVGPEDREVIVSRSIAEGGGKVRINGHLVTVSTLVEVAPGLVEIAGQHEHQRISSARDQLMLLDCFVGDEAIRVRSEVTGAVRAASAAEGKAAQLEAGERERTRELDVLRFEIAEIEATDVREGERADLLAQADRLEHAEAVAAAVSAARSELDDEGGAADSVRRAAAAVGRAADSAPALGALRDRLTSAALELEDVALELARETITPDPDALEAVRSRIAQIDRLRRKYGEAEVDILAYLQRSSARVVELEGAAQDVADARREASSERERARALADKLSSLRRDAVPRLAADLRALLSSLAMTATGVEIAVEATDLYEGGIDKVEFLISSPGHAPRPIGKVASGGELSRLALAFRLATTSSAGFASTLVFDEVDAGVGGEAARVVGRCLAELARTARVQVLVVTHLPQVAAAADAQFRVVRSTAADGSVAAKVEPVAGDARVDELSRMLAGLPDSATARGHAQELLDIATTP